MGFKRFVWAAVFAGFAAPAAADAVDDYSYWRTAAALDDLCHYLKWVERDVIAVIAADQLGQTGQYAHQLDGRMSREEYNAWLDGVDAAADAKGAEIGCTKAAEPYLLQARGHASDRIYQDLLLAFHFSGLPEGDTYRQVLAPDQVLAAQAYDGFLQQVYGANFAQFAAINKQAATARLPAGGNGQFDQLGFPTYGFDTSVYDPAFYDLMYESQGAARSTLEKVHFEVVAETNGLRVFPRWVDKYWRGTTINNADGSLYATLFDGPKSYRLDSGEEVYGVLVQSAAGAIRLMTYGTNATEKLKKTGVARLFIREGELPVDVYAYAAFDQADFRQMAFPWDGIPLDETCLGGPCWEFSAETLAAFFVTSPDEYAELWLSADPEAAPSATIEPASSYLRGRVWTWMLWKLNGKTPPAKPESTVK